MALMGDDSQVVVPEAFVALFVENGRQRLSASRLEIVQRHELCEELATSLTDRALQVLRDHDATEEEVLRHVLQGLASPASGLSPPEADWVTRRLAELLNWRQLPGNPER